jgi:heme oxygenase
MTSEPRASTEPFSAHIKAASHAGHAAANGSSFIGDLLGGKLGVAAYSRYTEQLWWIYRAIEESARDLAGSPVAGPFIRPELFRLPALERDLDHLHGGAAWRGTATALPATAAYVARVREVARTWPGGYVAHHYTRYLGDLSGGQIIRDAAERMWGFAHKGDGVRFYVFDDIPNPAAFKRDYRATLDAIPVDDLEKQRITRECEHAFALNVAVLGELSDPQPAGR